RVLLVRRVEAVALRRHAHVRTRRHPFLHEAEGRDGAMARPGNVGRRPRLPEDEVMSVQDELAEKERAAWRAFMDAVDRLPPDRFDERSVVPGWSAKDLMCTTWGGRGSPPTSLPRATGDR